MKMVPARCDGFIVFLRLKRQDGKNVTLCARAQHRCNKQIKMLKEHVALQAKISITSNHKYKKVHLLVMKTILLQVQMETEAVL